MNEYEVTVREGEARKTFLVEAETHAAATDAAELETDAEILNVRFVRALGFSCRQRGAAPGRP